MQTGGILLVLLTDLPLLHFNHAPLWVFVLLGLMVFVVALLLYFATDLGGGEKDYLYGDPSRQHYLQHPSYGPFGGFTHF